MSVIGSASDCGTSGEEVPRGSKSSPNWLRMYDATARVTLGGALSSPCAEPREAERRSEG